MWTDGRYFNQAGQQLDSNWTLMKQGYYPINYYILKILLSAVAYSLKMLIILSLLLIIGLPETPTQGAWLSKHLPSGSKVGVDPRLFSKEQWSPLSKTLGSSGHVLVPVEKNLIDLVWEERPPPPSNGIHPLGIEFAGDFEFESEIISHQSSIFKITFGPTFKEHLGKKKRRTSLKS